MNVISHLSQLESAGLVSLTQVTPDVEYLFRHTLVQEAAYASLLADDASHLHRLVGEAIEILYPDRVDEMAPSLGRHFEQAGDTEKAARYYEQAGRKAHATYAHHEAAEYFHKALHLAQDPAQQARLLATLGEAQALVGQGKTAIQTWKEGIALYKQLGDLDQVAYLFARSGRVAWFSNDPRLGLELCQEGMQYVKDAPDSMGIALLLHETGRAFFFNGRLEEALPLCKQALSMSKNLNAIAVQAESLITLGILPQVPAEERMALLKQGVELAETADLIHIASRAHLNLGSAYLSQFADFIKARQHYKRAAELAQRCGALQSVIFYLIAAGDISLALGELDVAEQDLQEIERLAQLLPEDNAARNDIKSFRLWPRAFRGYWEEAIPALKEQLERAYDTHNPQKIVEHNLAIVRTALELQRLKKPIRLGEASANMEEALHYAQQSESLTHFPVLKAYSAALQAYLGNFSAARSQLGEALKAAAQQDYHEKSADLKSFALEIAFVEGSWAEAINVYLDLKQDHRYLGAFDWNRVLLLTAEAYLKRGEPGDLEEAQSLLQETSAFFTKIRAPIYLELVAELVRSARALTHAQAAAQRKVTQELAQAGRLQSSFLPEEPPLLPGWHIAARLRSARQTTGDYYDFIPLPDGKLGVVIADVADKGIGAALFMTSSRTLLRAYAAENMDAPEKVLQQANQRITQDTPGGLFITLFYGVLNPQTGELVYCNAGHNPPFLLTPDGQSQSLPKTGIPLGIFTDAAWQSQLIALQPGAFLALYTDGVTEAADPGEQLFGETRLLAAMQSAANAPAASADSMAEAVLLSVDQFRGKTAQADDLTLVIIQRD